MPEPRRPRRSVTATTPERTALPREVAKLADSSVPRQKSAPGSKAPGAKARIVDRLKRLHPMD